MKKKVKDITLGELNAACKKYECRVCPFKAWCAASVLTREELEKEIDIPEEEN